MFPFRRVGEFFEEFLLFVGEILRELADEADVFVAAAACFYVRHAAAGQAHEAVVLGTGRNLHLDLAAECRNVDFPAEDEVVDAHGQIDIEIVTLSFVRRVLFEFNDQMKVAVRAVGSRAALTGETNPLPVADAPGNRDFESFVEKSSGAVALRAEPARFRPRSVTSRTDVLNL